MLALIIESTKWCMIGDKILYINPCRPWWEWVWLFFAEREIRVKIINITNYSYKKNDISI